MTDSNEVTFTEALMQHIMDHVKTPKVQVERIVGPILGMFIAEVLSVTLDDCIEMISPEFPLRKSPLTNQSTNIDWLLYSTKHDQLVFLELKTTDTTFEAEQAAIYLAVISRIKKEGAAFLAADVKQIESVSAESGKYHEVLTRIQSDRYPKCRNARLIYLAPGTMCKTKSGILDAQVQWLNFTDLPAQISSCFAREWSVIRRYLVELDSISRQTRNGLRENDRQRNFAGTCQFDELIAICAERQDAIVVGFLGGSDELRAASLDELRGRSSYKWDHAEQGTGTKDLRNWISGREFLELTEKVRSSAASA